MWLVMLKFCAENQAYTKILVIIDWRGAPDLGVSEAIA